VAKLVDATDLGSVAVRCGGSSPPSRSFSQCRGPIASLSAQPNGSLRAARRSGIGQGDDVKTSRTLDKQAQCLSASRAQTASWPHSEIFACSALRVAPQWPAGRRAPLGHPPSLALRDARRLTVHCNTILSMRRFQTGSQASLRYRRLIRESPKTSGRRRNRRNYSVPLVGLPHAGSSGPGFDLRAASHSQHPPRLRGRRR
jgi:hypothetical protein